jgi:uncharacterized OB-fold protein
VTDRPDGALPAALATLAPDRWTEPFWRATAEHRLVCARCGDCGRHRMPPSPFCPRCRSQALEWDDLPGTGTVFTFTVVRHAVVPSVRDDVPYIVAVVDLDGAPGARLVANLLDVEPEAVAVGDRVEVVWDDCAPDTTIPRLRPMVAR